MNDPTLRSSSNLEGTDYDPSTFSAPIRTPPEGWQCGAVDVDLIGRDDSPWTSVFVGSEVAYLNSSRERRRRTFVGGSRVEVTHCPSTVLLLHHVRRCQAWRMVVLDQGNHVFSTALLPNLFFVSVQG